MHQNARTPNAGAAQPGAPPSVGSVHDDSDVQKKQVERESTLPFAQSAALAGVYMFGCITFFLLIRKSKMIEREGGPRYDSAAAVFFTELFKCIFSVAMMYYRTGKFLPVSVIREGTWKTGLYYAVPSAIYAVYNNLTYWNLTYFDPGTYQVFMQTRVLFTGLLYSYLLKKALGQRKWTALVILSIGVASKYLSWNLEINGYVFFMLFQASLSAFAGVYNEYLLKRDISMDVNEQNFFMYTFALAFNLLIGLYSDPVYYTSLQFVGSLNGIVLAIVINGAIVGIVTSLILKFINVIIKAFASACEVLLTAVFAYFLLNEPLSFRDVIASTIVMGSIYMYYTAPAAVSVASSPTAPPVGVVGSGPGMAPANMSGTKPLDDLDDSNNASSKHRATF